MNLNSIISKTIKHEAKPQGNYHTFAVLLPLIETPEGIKIIFEVRSHKLKKQPGEVCFPGGKVDKGESFLDAAVRETCEELNIEKHNIKIIGELDYLVTPYNLIIYPFVGIIDGIAYEEINYSTDEVHELFTMDLDFALNKMPDLHNVNLLANPKDDFPYHMVLQGENYKWRIGNYPVPFYNYNNRIIWGFTARVLMNFAEVLKTESEKAHK